MKRSLSFSMTDQIINLTDVHTVTGRTRDHPYRQCAELRLEPGTVRCQRDPLYHHQERIIVCVSIETSIFRVLEQRQLQVPTLCHFIITVSLRRAVRKQIMLQYCMCVYVTTTHVVLMSHYKLEISFRIISRLYSQCRTEMSKGKKPMQFCAPQRHTFLWRSPGPETSVLCARPPE